MTYHFPHLTFTRSTAASAASRQPALAFSDTVVSPVRPQVQDVAIRCIQKNVRKYVGVRDWPWWRLLVRVTPLLDVHRTEQQLQSATVRRG